MSAAVGTGVVATRAAASRPNSLSAASSGSGFEPSGVSAVEICTNETPSSRRTTLYSMLPGRSARNCSKRGSPS